MKYNWSIIGHEKVLEQIEADIESGNIFHAYLLAGPKSIGKSTVARKMAGILQCENDFCHECKTCLQIQRASHIDTTEFPDDGTSIKIGDIRKMLERVNMSSQSKRKIFLIQSVERMTLEAANSFLKTLEEPPEDTIFLMTTSNPGLLLPTITSRVRTVKFENVSAAFLMKKLKELYPERSEEEIEKAGLFSLGRTGKAVQLIENPEVLSDYSRIYNDIQNFLKFRNLAERFGYVENIYQDLAQTEIFLELLAHVLRTKMLDEGSGIYANKLSKIDETAMLLQKNVNARLALENLMLTL